MKNAKYARRMRGFTLVETALVMVIGSMLVMAVVMPLGMQMQIKRVSDTRQGMEDIKSSLLGFAIVNGRFPCPDTDNDGAENRVVAGLASTCQGVAGGVATGHLPWVNLGIGTGDAWHHRYRYAVTREFAEQNASGASFTLATVGTLQICSTVPAPCTPATRLATAVPVVILSFGANGLGATTEGGVVLPGTGATAEETENIGGNTSAYISHAISPADSAAGQFDDLLTWLPAPFIMNRMVAAGRLP